MSGKLCTNRTVKSGKCSTICHSPQLSGKWFTTFTSRSGKLLTTSTSMSGKCETSCTCTFNQWDCVSFSFFFYNIDGRCGDWGCRSLTQPSQPRIYPCSSSCSAWPATAGSAASNCSRHLLWIRGGLLPQQEAHTSTNDLTINVMRVLTHVRRERYLHIRHLLVGLEQKAAPARQPPGMPRAKATCSAIASKARC